MAQGIVCLCGSVRFKEDFDKANERFTLAGWIVVAPGCFNHEFLHRPENNAELLKDGLDRLHMEKIEMADMVFVINRGGYIGMSTRNEINYAETLGKKIVYMEASRWEDARQPTRTYS